VEPEHFAPLTRLDILHIVELGLFRLGQLFTFINPSTVYANCWLRWCIYTIVSLSYASYPKSRTRFIVADRRQLLSSGSHTLMQRSLRACKRRRWFYTTCLEHFDDYDAPLLGAGASANVAVNDELAVKLFVSGPNHKRDYEREVKICRKLKSRGLLAPYFTVRRSSLGMRDCYGIP
jgi:hypothetical protein